MSDFSITLSDLKAKILAHFYGFRFFQSRDLIFKGEDDFHQGGHNDSIEWEAETSTESL